jgi:hypothetical protein
MRNVLRKSSYIEPGQIDRSHMPITVNLFLNGKEGPLVFYTFFRRHRRGGNLRQGLAREAAGRYTVSKYSMQSVEAAKLRPE